MPIYDVSVALSADTPTYPGDPGINISQFLSLENGDPANVSLLHFGAHSGTHVDAPAHFIAGGGRVNSLPLETLIGRAQVVEVPTTVDTITAEFITRHCTRGETRYLFKTRNSSFWDDDATGFRSDYTSLEPAAARQLAQMGVKLVGIDYLSIEDFGAETFETHHALLSQGIVIVEGLDLRQISAGAYELICLPLRIAGGSGDGAPARVVLRTIDPE
ncbi:MAG: cyclase family protein [Acidobacteriota bacterium]|nr:cyclase family protein [Acidobacteriota bacterium]